jgi:hypothetical protein
VPIDMPIAPDRRRAAHRRVLVDAVEGRQLVLAPDQCVGVLAHFGFGGIDDGRGGGADGQRALGHLVPDRLALLELLRLALDHVLQVVGRDLAGQLAHPGDVARHLEPGLGLQRTLAAGPAEAAHRADVAGPHRPLVGFLGPRHPARRGRGRRGGPAAQDRIHHVGAADRAADRGDLLIPREPVERSLVAELLRDHPPLDRRRQRPAAGVEARLQGGAVGLAQREVRRLGPGLDPVHQLRRRGGRRGRLPLGAVAGGGQLVHSLLGALLLLPQRVEGGERAGHLGRNH